MAYLNDDPVWEEGVRQLEVTDDCEAGVFNEPLGQLARRTVSLKQAVEAGKSARQSAVRGEADARQEGVAAAMEALEALGNAMQAKLDAKAPDSHASNDAAYGAGSDANYGHVKLNSSTVPAMNGTVAVGASGKAADASHVHPTDTTRAPLASPALTGTPTAPTAAVSVNSTQIATTAFAHAAAKNDAWPVGSFYTQYPLTGQSTIANMFPSSGSPAALFGGTWTEMYAGEKVFFMGGLSSVESNRSSGIQQDAIRNMTGKFLVFPEDWDDGGIVRDATGMFFISKTGTPSGGSLALTGNQRYCDNVNFDASRAVSTDSTNHPKNRPVKVWRRTA